MCMHVRAYVSEDSVYVSEDSVHACACVCE